MKSSDLDECVLCCREITIFSVGACDHPVCYECSARMRVLCETTECPICRSDMPLVIFTLERQPFSEISRKFSLFDKKFRIVFENSQLQRSFQLLLENKCKVCDDIFPTFNKLKDHLRRVHSLQYCELCAENLKIFPFERKTYDRKELARHKRTGDPDETSHRGHPLCEFCEQRYVDSDDLFRHLRREHYFCHFCDADGKSNQVYEDYRNLRVHFREEHYLCEEGDCANEQFTGAFRSVIDLKAHIAQHHCKNKSKAEARQTRMLELEFTYAHHNRPNASSSPKGNRYKHQNRQNIEENNSRDSKASQPETEKIDTQSTLEFPYLSEDGEISNVVPNSNLNSMTLQSFSRNSVPQRHKNVMSVDDFPALVSTTVSVTSEVQNNQSRKFNFSIQRQNNVPARAPNVSIHLAQRSAQPKSTETNGREMDNKTQKPSWIAKKNTTFENEFPKLEPKRTPVSFTNVVNTTVVNKVPSKPQATVEVVSNPHSSGTAEQFIIIKSKSKKKKQGRTFQEDKASDNKDDTDEKDDQPSSTDFLSSNNNFNLLDQDVDIDRFKKNLCVPNSKTNYIEEDTWRQKVHFGKDDFPPLAPAEPVRRPPGFNGLRKKPPPGFSAPVDTSRDFEPLNLTLSSVARQLVAPNKNNNVKTEIPHSEFSYKKPYDFEQRNEILAQKVRQLSVFDEFKEASKQFRCSEISAATYYSMCLKIFNDKEFMDIFPELISLLPDINKQQELLDIHKKYQNNSGAVPKQKVVTNKISVCDVCYQVLVETDYQHHILKHESEFSH